MNIPPHLDQEIQEAVKRVPGWTDLANARELANVIVKFKPTLSLEIGVLNGRGLIVLGLAHKHIGLGLAVGIDPYFDDGSDEAKLLWGHMTPVKVFENCLFNILSFKVEDFVSLERVKSDDYTPPGPIGLLRIDGSHGEQALKDYDRYLPFIQPGGFVFTDDEAFGAGHIQKAVNKMRTSGEWEHIKQTGTGGMYRRRL